MNPRGPAGVAICLAALSGCGSSPNATFYALSPRAGAVQPDGPHDVKIRRPGLAGYLDRPSIVRRVVDFRLGVADSERWGEPLDRMFARVLAQDVEQRLPDGTVFTEDGAITAAAEVTVEVDVHRFDVGDDGKVNLVAEVALEGDGGRARRAFRSVTLREAPASSSTSALVAAMSDLLGELADRIAMLVREPHEKAAMAR